MENKMNNIIKFTDKDMLELAGFIDEIHMGLDYNITYTEEYIETDNGSNIEAYQLHKERKVEWLNLPKIFSNDELQEQLEEALTTYYDKNNLFEE